MISNKPGIQLLVEICASQNLQHIVFSPGSRNAPIVISFDDHPQFNCLSIPDERVAAFFAMGMAQQLMEPIIICCTSGSAALNYAPGVVEAYYQKIPLIILTADRPVDRIDQGAGQTMRQRDVYANYIKHSCELIEEANSEKDLEHNAELINNAIHIANTIPHGPVHINIPLEEPLYDRVEKSQIPLPSLKAIESENLIIPIEEQKSIIEAWRSYKKKLIICGQSPPDKMLDKELSRLSEDSSVAIITETTANINCNEINQCIDRLITTIEELEIDDFKPDLLVSIGDAIISKKIKKLLQKNKPKEHWFVNEQVTVQDTYRSVTKHIRSSSINLLTCLPSISSLSSHFKSTWSDRNKATRDRHLNFLKECKWSDLKAFEIILESIPAETDLHIANSSPIRYVQLFDQRQDLQYFSNRGVSGIDGCTSTAMGSAFATKNKTTLITGDLAFFYDSNAFWHEHTSSNLKVILINNGGGGIFRIIPGPSSTNQYKKFFSTDQHYSAEHIAKAYNCNYLKANSVVSLKENLQILYNQHFEKPVILEIDTVKVESEKVLEEYFDYLKSNS